MRTRTRIETCFLRECVIMIGLRKTAEPYQPNGNESETGRQANGIQFGDEII